MAEQPTTKALRATPAAEVRTRLDALRLELWQQRQKAKDGALKQTHQLRALRRQIARVHTVLREARSP